MVLMLSFVCICETAFITKLNCHNQQGLLWASFSTGPTLADIVTNELFWSASRYLSPIIA